MWFYYFICLSVVLSFRDGVVDAGLSLFHRKPEPANKCVDLIDCGNLTPSLCTNGISGTSMLRTCPKTCNVCKELGLEE